MLRTNIELDERLVEEAMRLTQKKTKKELVNYALSELITRLKRKRILELEGQVAWTGNLHEIEADPGMILVDTSVWIDFFNGADSPERHALHRLLEEEEDICLTGIVLTEILQGLRVDKDFRRVRDYLLEFPMYDPQGPGTYLQAAETYRDCQSKGRTVRKTIDCLIAAICLENDLVLLHKDGDFDLIESLRVFRS